MAYQPGLNGGRINASLSGNSTSAGGGYSLVSTGTFYLAGGNNVTLSQNANTVTISAANQTNAAVSGANGSSTFQTLSMANSNGVSFSTGTQGLYATVQTNYLTTARASNDALGTNTAQTNVTWTANSSGLSINAAGYAGTGTTFAGANISGSMTNNSVGLNLSLSAAAPGGGAGFSAGVSTGGNIAGNSSVVSSQLIFAGGNNITLSEATAAGGNATVTISAANQSNQQMSIYAASNTYSTTSATMNASAMSFVGSGAASVGVTNGSVMISGAALGLNTAGSNVTWTANTSGLSLDARGYAGTGTTFAGTNVSASITHNSAGLNLALSAGAGGGAAGSNTFGISNLGNAVGNTGVISGSAEQLLFAGGNNITLSQATAAGAATITVNAAAQSAQTQSNIAGFYDGASSISTGTVFLSDGNGVSFGVTGQTITASVAAGGNDGYNSAQFTNSTANSTMPILWAGNSNGSGNITMGLTGSTVTASAAGGGGANPQISFYQNLAPNGSAQPHTPLTVAFNTLVLQPLSPMEGYGFPGDMTVSTLMMQMSGTGTSTAAVSSSYSSKVLFGIYSMVNSSQLSLVNSASTAWSQSANSANTTAWVGARFLTFHSSQWSTTPVLSDNGRYWYGILHQSTNFSAMGPNWMGQYLAASTQRSGTWGVSASTGNTSQGHIPFLGIFSSSTSALPATIGNSQINKNNATAGFMPGLILNATVSAF